MKVIWKKNLFIRTVLRSNRKRNNAGADFIFELLRAGWIQKTESKNIRMFGRSKPAWNMARSFHKIPNVISSKTFHCILEQRSPIDISSRCVPSVLGITLGTPRNSTWKSKKKRTLYIVHLYRLIKTKLAYFTLGPSNNIW